MAEPVVYGTEFALLYDLFHAGKPYRREARFVRRETDRRLGTRGTALRLLDLACGTGTHAIELSGLRFSVTGVDRSPVMLSRARRKARAAGRRIRFVEQDLSRLSLPGKPWDVVTCLFDSLGYLVSDLRVSRALQRIWQVLVPGGLLFLEVWHTPAIVSSFDELRVRRLSAEGLEAVRISETKLLAARSAAAVRYEIFSRRDKGAWRRVVETHVNRHFSASSLGNLVEQSGFRVLDTLGGLAASSRLSDDCFHLVILAERIGGPS